jgi:hypothetical protein
MKKIILIAVLLLAGVSIFFLLRDDEEITAVDLLPKNVIGYIRQDNLTEIYKKYDSSKLGKTIKAIDYNSIINDLNLPQQSHDFLEQGISDIKETINNPLLHEIFGEHFIIALLANTTIYPNVSGTDNLRESFLIIAKPKRSVKALTVLAKLIPQGNGSGELEYQHEKIFYYKLDEQFTLYASVVANRVLLSFSDTVIKSAIDCRRNKSTGLKTNKAFKKAQEKHKDALQFAFFQAAPLKETILAYIKAYSPKDLDAIANELKLLNNYSHFSSAVYPVKDGILKNHAAIVFNPDKMDDAMKNIVFIQPEENEMVQMVPEDLLLYYWTNTFLLKNFYDFGIRERNLTSEQIEKFQTEIQKNTGMSPDEIFALFDHRPTFLLRDSDVPFFLPVPDFGLYIRITDKEKFERMMNKVIKDNKIVTHREKYGEDSLTIWGEYSQNSMQLSYTVHGDYLVLASSKLFIEDIIDHLDRPVVFSEKNGFAQVTKGFHDENNVLCYVQLQSFFKIMKEVTSWGGTLMAIQDRNAAQKSKIVIDRLIHPLIDGMDMYKALGYRISMVDNTMTVDTVVRIDEEKE